MFWDSKTIEDSLNEEGHYAVILGPFDRSWNPGRTNDDYSITGPAIVSYTRDPVDLGWDVSVNPFDINDPDAPTLDASDEVPVIDVPPTADGGAE